MQRLFIDILDLVRYNQKIGPPKRHSPVLGLPAGKSSPKMGVTKEACVTGAVRAFLQGGGISSVAH